MRILLITPYPPTRDGIGTYSQSLREAFVDQGHEVRVLAARADEPALPETLGAISARGDGAAQRPLLEAIDGFSPEVVHVQFAVAAYAASLFALLRLVRRLRERGYPIVMTMHEVTRDTNSLRAPGRALYRHVASLADLAILHTDGAARCLRDLLGSRGLEHEVIPHPSASLPEADTTPAELAARFGLTGHRVILSFGFIDIDKGIQDLIRAVSLLRRKPELDDVRLVIAGTVRERFGPFRIFEFRDRAYLAFLKRTVSRLGLEQRVVWAGYVPSGSMAPWFELAELAALPYRRCEASGVANIAAAAGTPIVATSVGELVSLSAVPELPPADPAAFARGLEQQLSGAAPGGGAGAAPSAEFLEIATRTAEAYGRLAAGA